MFRTSARTLAVALMRVLPVVEHRNSIPILGCIRLRRETAGHVVLTGTDLDVQLDVTATVEPVGGEGEIAIDPRRLLAIARLLPRSDAIELVIDGEGVVLTWNGGKARFRGLAASDMPEMVVDGDLAHAALDAQAGDALRRVQPFISREETRYYLNGVCIDGGAFVATDGHRLAAMPGGETLAALSAQLGDHRPIVPTRTLGLWLDMAGRGDVAVDFSLNAGCKMRMTAEDMVVSSKTIDGTFPPWRRILPDRSALTQVQLSRHALLRAVGLVSALAARGGAHGMLSFDAGRAQVLAKMLDDAVAADIGEAPGIAAEVPVNLRYLLHALNAVRGKTVTLWLPDGGHSPFALEGSESAPDEHVVIMPLRNLEPVNFRAPELVLAA